MAKKTTKTETKTIKYYAYRNGVNVYENGEVAYQLDKGDEVTVTKMDGGTVYIDNGFTVKRSDLIGVVENEGNNE